MNLLENLILLQNELSVRFPELAGQMKLPEQKVEKARLNTPGVTEHYKTTVGESPKDPYPNQAKIAIYNLVNVTIGFLNSSLIEKGLAVTRGPGPIREILNALDKNTWVPFIVDEETQALGLYLQEFLKNLTENDFTGYGLPSQKIFSQLSTMSQILDTRLAHYEKMKRASDVKGHEINQELTDQYTTRFIDLSAIAQAELKTIQNGLINDLRSQNDPEVLTQMITQAIESASTVKEGFEKLEQLEFDYFNEAHATLPDSELKLNFLGQVPRHAQKAYQETLEEFIDHYYGGAQREKIKKQYQNELKQPLSEVILSLLSTGLSTDKQPALYHKIFRYLDDDHGTKFIETIDYKNTVNSMHNKKRKETIHRFDKFIRALNDVRNSLQEYLDLREQVKEIYANYSSQSEHLQLDEVQTMAQKSELLDVIEKNIPIVESIDRLLSPKKQNPFFAALNPFEADTFVVSNRLRIDKQALEGMQEYLTYSKEIKELHATYSQKLEDITLDENFPNKDIKDRKSELLDAVNRDIEVVQSIEKRLTAIEKDPHVKRLNLKKPNPFKNEISVVLKDLQNKKAALEGIDLEPRKKTKIDSNYDQHLGDLNSSINLYFREIHKLEGEIYRSQAKDHDLVQEYINLKREIEFLSDLKNQDIDEIIQHPEDLSHLTGHHEKISLYVQDIKDSRSWLSRALKLPKPDQKPILDIIENTIRRKQRVLEKMLPHQLATVRSHYAKAQLESSFLRIEKAFVERPTKNETQFTQNLKSGLEKTLEKMKRDFTGLGIDWNHYDKRFTLTQQLFSLMSNHAELIENKPKMEEIIQELKELKVNTENLEQDLAATLKSIEPFTWSIAKAKILLKTIQENEVKFREALSDEGNVKDASLSQLFTQTEEEFLSLDKMIAELENLSIGVSSLKEKREKLEINVSFLKAQTSLKRIQENEVKLRAALSDPNTLKNASLMQLFSQTQEEFLSLDKILVKLEKFSSDLSSLKEQKEKLESNISSLKEQKEEKIKQKIAYNLQRFENKREEGERLSRLERSKYNLASYKQIREYLHNRDRIEPGPSEKTDQQVEAITQEINEINAKATYPDLIESLFAMLCQLFNWTTQSQRRTTYSQELSTAYQNYKKGELSHDLLIEKIDQGLNEFPEETFKKKLEELKTSLPIPESQQTSVLFSNN